MLRPNNNMPHLRKEVLVAYTGVCFSEVRADFALLRFERGANACWMRDAAFEWLIYIVGVGISVSLLREMLAAV